MRIGNRPGWAWFSPEDAPWWSPAAVHYALLTKKIEPTQVLPRLAGCGHGAQFDDEWVNRFDDPWDAMVDDDPDVSTVPGSMSRRWMELLADELDGDRAAAVRFLADASNATRAGEQSLRLRDLQLFITTATVAEPRPASGWLAQGSFWFLNAGLLTPATLVDVIELQATAAALLLPGAEVFGVVAEPDEGEFTPSRVLAAYQVGVDDPSSDVGRRGAIDRLQRWLDGEPLESLQEVPGDVVGFTNKTARYGRIRDNFDW